MATTSPEAGSALEARTVAVRTRTGGTGDPLALDERTFGITPNVAVMHQVVTAQLANRRAGTQSTLTRAEVRGGGKKPWKQKGTGRARQGSIRAPHWVGGGIAHGPKPRSYAQRTPKKMIQLALRSALSDRAADGRVAVVEAWDFDAPSTKGARAALEALGLSGRVLLVLDRDDETAAKSFRNLPEVQACLVSELNAYDVLCNDWVVFTRATLPGSAAKEAAAASAPVAGPANVVIPEIFVPEVATPAAGSVSLAGAPSPAADAPAATADVSSQGDDVSSQGDDVPTAVPVEPGAEQMPGAPGVPPGEVAVPGTGAPVIPPGEEDL